MATCLHRNILICIKVDARVLLTLKINICGLSIGKGVWFAISTVPPRARVPTAAATSTTTPAPTTLARTNYGAATTNASRARPTRVATNNSCVA